MAIELKKFLVELEFSLNTKLSDNIYKKPASVKSPEGGLWLPVGRKKSFVCFFYMIQHSLVNKKL